MRTTVKPAMHFLFSAVVAGYGISAVMPEAASQEAGWITLFDGKDLDGWDQVGGSNWHVADGAIVADTMVDKKEPGYLVTKKPYKNFIVRVEFMPSDDANSGIYFRCLDPKKITDRTCYEANIFDQRPDPSYGTGAITRYVEVNPMRQKPAVNGIHTKSRRTDATLLSFSMARRQQSCATACSMMARSRCSTAPAPSNSARFR